MMQETAQRTYEESCALLDEIVGHCVRERAFAHEVLDDPAAALASYHLHQHELDDFVTLSRDHPKAAAAGWAGIRDAIELLRCRQNAGQPQI